MLVLSAMKLSAQTTITNVIPLNEKIEITLLGGDDELLHCYNLYGFHYYDGADSVLGEFIVLKDADSFTNKVDINIKLCRVKEFSIAFGKKCRSLKVDQGIQVKHKGQAEPVFLNFDPLGPEPVFIPCK